MSENTSLLVKPQSPVAAALCSCSIQLHCTITSVLAWAEFLQALYGTDKTTSLSLQEDKMMATAKECQELKTKYTEEFFT